MRFLSVRDFRANSAAVWRDLPQEREIIITNNGRPVAMLTAVDERNLEKSLSAWRQVRAIQAVADIQRESVAKGTDKITMEEIDAVIARVRKSRQRSEK